MLRRKLYCCRSPSHLTRENFVSLSTFYLFTFFLFFSPLRRLPHTCRVLLIWTHQKVRTHGYVTSIEIVYFGRSLTWFTIAKSAYFLQCILFTKRRTRLLNNRWWRHLCMSFLRIKNLKSKHLHRKHCYALGFASPLERIWKLIRYKLIKLQKFCKIDKVLEMLLGYENWYE